MTMHWKSFPHYPQLESADCGPSCLRMIAKYYGRSYSVQYLREQAFITREGVSMLGISDAAERIGFRTMGVKVTLEQLREEVPLPCILQLILPFLTQSLVDTGIRDGNQNFIMLILIA